MPQWQAGPTRFDGVADIHARPQDGAYVDDIVRRTLAMQPAAIFLLGDFMAGHEPKDSMSAEELESRLQAWRAAGIPMYGVLGNHDYYYGEEEVRAMWQRLGAQMLEGRSTTLQLAHGQRLHLGGVRCLYVFRQKPGPLPQNPATTAEQREREPFIFLSHTPSGARFAPAGTLITLAGHSHGGQVCLPGGYPLKSPDRHTPREHSAGFATVTDQTGRPSLLYTTRGLGTSILPLRAFCPPELFCLEIDAPAVE